MGSTILGHDRGGHGGKRPKVGYRFLHEEDGVLIQEKFLGASWGYGGDYRMSRT